MGLLTKNDFPSLQALYTAQLRYLLSTENQILKGLEDMIEHADDQQLKQAFQSHRQETEVHVSRLEQLIGDVNNDVDDKKDPILTADCRIRQEHHQGNRFRPDPRCWFDRYRSEN